MWAIPRLPERIGVFHQDLLRLLPHDVRPKGSPVLAIVISMIIVLAIVVAITGLVVVGIEGRGRDRMAKVNHKLAPKMARPVQHLNGEVR